MSGGRRLEVSLRREIELWQRPPVTAMRVLKFCRARSFCEGETADGVEDEKRSWLPQQPDWFVVPHLSHMDELGEDLGPLLGCVSAEDHQLDPLGHAVAHHDRALQGGVFPHRAPHHVAAVVQELANRIAELTHGTAWMLNIKCSRYLLKCYRSSWTPGSSGVQPSHPAPCGRRSTTPSSSSSRGTGPGRHSHAGF